MRLACHDSSLPGYPIRVTIHGALHRLTLDQAHQLYEELGGALLQSEPPDTQPAPPATPEPATSPGTPAARRRSSDSMQAVTGPATGLARRVADELAKGREPT